MTLKNAWGWVALGIGTVAVMAALVHVERQWQAHSLEERGRALVAEERYLPAIRVLLQAVAEAPGNASAHHYLGLAYAGIGLCGAAWIHIDEAARLAPDQERGHAGLGPACRGPAIVQDVPGQFDHAVQRDR